MPISTPAQITVPFATSGLKNSIPAASDPVNGKAGYDAGFPAINMAPKTAGGIPPFGQDFNGIFFDVTTALRFLEAGGSFPFSSAFSTAVGGYPLGALVSRTDGSGLWRNTVANNTTDPEAFGAGWLPEDAGITSVAMSNANVTLTALQAAKTIIVITGTLTANLNLIFPTYLKQWLVVNRATGAFSVTCKTAAGGGVIVPTGMTQPIYSDALDILASVTVNGAATETTSGILRLATQAETNAGTNATAAITPLKLRFGFGFSLGTTGYITLPTWLGGFIMQWGRVTLADATKTTVSFSVTFPQQCVAGWTGLFGDFSGDVTNGRESGIANLANASALISYNDNNGGSSIISWFVIGA